MKGVDDRGEKEEERGTFKGLLRGVANRGKTARKCLEFLWLVTFGSVD